MQQFILEKKLEGICDKDGRDYEEVVELEKDDFIQVMLKIHQANSMAKYGENHKKWRNWTYPSKPTSNMWRTLSSG
jgi:hypothetical protein